MASLLVNVRKKMTIAAHRKVRGALEGEYASVSKGRSMDFDDLRLYNPGDDIKDIDWKATARNGQILIRRYVAIRKYNILLVVDTGRTMAATAPTGESKRDISVMTAGVIASVAQKHGDLVGLVAGDNKHIARLPMKDSRPHVERILQFINTQTTLEAPQSNLANLLEYVRRTIKRRMMLIIISDNIQFAGAEEQLLKRLQAQHELMFIALDDLNPSADEWNTHDVYDVDRTVSLPPYLRAQKAVKAAYEESVKDHIATATHLLSRLGIASVRVKAEDEIITQIVRLLERQKRGRR